ncbi:hypothetical protein C7S15_5511 [Burkholderia cepacia]|nr:hypothetical protein [Burkholderia cepacia]
MTGVILRESLHPVHSAVNMANATLRDGLRLNAKDDYT